MQSRLNQPGSKLDRFQIELLAVWTLGHDVVQQGFRHCHLQAFAHITRMVPGWTIRTWIGKASMPSAAKKRLATGVLAYPQPMRRTNLLRTQLALIQIDKVWRREYNAHSLSAYSSKKACAALNTSSSLPFSRACSGLAWPKDNLAVVKNCNFAPPGSPSRALHTSSSECRCKSVRLKNAGSSAGQPTPGKTSGDAARLCSRLGA